MAAASIPPAGTSGPAGSDSPPPSTVRTAVRPNSERRSSRDPAMFGVPTGREEDWRFTPLARLRPMLEPMPAALIRLDIAAPPEVVIEFLPITDELVGSVLTPHDRVSA